MGELQHIEISFAPGAGEALAKAVTDVIQHHATAIVPPRAATPATPEGAGLVPWEIYGPHEREMLIAFVDLENQVHHVPRTREWSGDIPDGWRKVWLQ